MFSHTCKLFRKRIIKLLPFFRFDKVKCGLKLEIKNSNEILVPKRFYCTIHDGISPLRFIHDKVLYFKLCQQIKQNSGHVLPIQLAHVPFGTRNHRLEKYFLENVLPSWWNLIELNLTNISGTHLASTMYNLQTIDKFCKGNLSKFLDWTNIEKLAGIALGDVKQKNFQSK